jgi:pimeloyl-ACP methyl ester carboxylesterase
MWRIDGLLLPRILLFPREEQERLARAIPHATLRVYPDTGHAGHWERPEWVVRDLEAFMSDTRPA